MRARMKRRQMIRRVTILGTVAIIGISLAVGIYLISTSQGPLGGYIGKPVSSLDMAALYQDSLAPYGQPPPNAMQNLVKASSGPLYTAGTKPVVVYIGAEFCPYCAVERYPLIIALMRFGNFSNLHYTLSSAADIFPNSPTFTFVGSSYQSRYVAFQAFENEDRNRNLLEQVPSNYTQVWQGHGSGYPFLNFGNKYILPSSTVTNTISGKNWTQVLQEIRTGDSLGIEVKESANLMTAMICKLTGQNPASVCGSYPISTVTMGIASPISSGLAVAALPPAPAGHREQG